MTDTANDSVVLTQLQVSFHMESDLVHSVGKSSVFKILLQTDVRTSIMASPPALTNSAGMLSTPDDFPIFNTLNAASTSFRWICSSSDFYGQSSTVRSPTVS